MILSNQVHCNNCGDEPYSSHRHDFVHCECRSVAVDGGTSYLRRVFNDRCDYREMSIEINDKAYNACVEAIKWSKDTGRNDFGLISSIVRALRDNGVEINDTVRNLSEVSSS
jgi:hypothetical protein